LNDVIQYIPYLLLTIVVNIMPNKQPFIIFHKLSSKPNSTNHECESNTTLFSFNSGYSQSVVSPNTGFSSSGAW
jgi:hypothetical protein